MYLDRFVADILLGLKIKGAAFTRGALPLYNVIFRFAIKEMHNTIQN